MFKLLCAGDRDQGVPRRVSVDEPRSEVDVFFASEPVNENKMSETVLFSS
jgi:hypothetical protein